MPREELGLAQRVVLKSIILSVYLALSKLPANNNRGHGFKKGSGQIYGSGADCYASAKNPAFDQSHHLQHARQARATLDILPHAPAGPSMPNTTTARAMNLIP